MKLAIEGGIPVRQTMLVYGRQTIDEDDVSAVSEVLRSDWLTTGPKVDEFENAIALEVGAKHAVVVSSGTAALHAACFAAGIGPGDEVVTTPLTFAASANCIRYQGGSVVFADIEASTLNIDYSMVELAVSPRTKALIPVDFGGQPADLYELNKLARSLGALVIEDACHALASTYRGNTVGSISDMTVFSFHPVKHITTGEGGVVTTDDNELAERIRMFRNHGISVDHHLRGANSSWIYEISDLGYNYRLSDIHSALGLIQLRKLKGWVKSRRNIASTYSESFSQIPEIEAPFVKADRQSSWHLYPIRLNLEMLRVGRDQIFQALRSENIGVNVHYIPVHWHPYYQKMGFKKGSMPIAEGEYERLLSLPMWPGMTERDVSDTIEAVQKVIEAYHK